LQVCEDEFQDNQSAIDGRARILFPIPTAADELAYMWHTKFSGKFDIFFNAKIVEITGDF